VADTDTTCLYACLPCFTGKVKAPAIATGTALLEAARLLAFAVAAVCGPSGLPLVGACTPRLGRQRRAVLAVMPSCVASALRAEPPVLASLASMLPHAAAREPGDACVAAATPEEGSLAKLSATRGDAGVLASVARHAAAAGGASSAAHPLSLPGGAAAAAALWDLATDLSSVPLGGACRVTSMRRRSAHAAMAA
jgi:hypothetical protein